MQDVTLAVHNPVATTEIERVRPAERLKDLNGKRICLVWNRKARGDVAMRKVAEVLKQRFTGLEFPFFEMQTSIALVPEQIQRLKQLKIDAVISSTGD